MKKKLHKKKTKKTRSEDAQSDEEATEGVEQPADDAPTAGRPPAVNYKEFVKLWISAGSVSEVADALGIKTTSATAVASRLRKAGVKLQKFAKRGAQEIDVRQLNRIADGKDD